MYSLPSPTSPLPPPAFVIHLVACDWAVPPYDWLTMGALCPELTYLAWNGPLIRAASVKFKQHKIS